MSSLIDSLTSLIRSIFDTALNALSSVFALVQDLFSMVLDLFSKVLGFVTGNLVIIGVLAVAVIGYGAYLQQNPQQKKKVMNAAKGKKRN